MYKMDRQQHGLGQSRLGQDGQILYTPLAQQRSIRGGKKIASELKYFLCISVIVVVWFFAKAYDSSSTSNNHANGNSHVAGSSEERFWSSVSFFFP